MNDDCRLTAVMRRMDDHSSVIDVTYGDESEIETSTMSAQNRTGVPAFDLIVRTPRKRSR